MSLEEKIKAGYLAASTESEALHQRVAELEAALAQCVEAFHRSAERMVFAEPWSAAEIDIEFAKKAIDNARSVLGGEGMTPLKDEDYAFSLRRQSYIDSLTEQEFLNEIQNKHISRTTRMDSGQSRLSSRSEETTASTSAKDL